MCVHCCPDVQFCRGEEARHSGNKYSFNCHASSQEVTRCKRYEDALTQVSLKDLVSQSRPIISASAPELKSCTQQSVITVVETADTSHASSLASSPTRRTPSASAGTVASCTANAMGTSNSRGGGSLMRTYHRFGANCALSFSSILEIECFAGRWWRGPSR